MEVKHTKLNKIRALLGLDVKLEQMKLDNGAVLEAEVFEAGYPIFVVSEDERIPVPAGEYTLEDGSILVVAEEGVIGEIKSADQPEAPAEEQQMEEEEPKAKKVVESTVKETHFSAEDFENLVKRVAALEEKIEKPIEVPTVEVEASEEKPVEVELEARKHSPETKSEPKKYSNNKRPRTVMDRVFEKLNP